MAEGKKSPRSKAPARSGGAGGSGGPGGKSGGPRRSGGGKGGQSGGQSGGGGGGWSTSKPGGKPGGSRSGTGKPGGKPGGFRKDERSEDRRDDRREDRRDDRKAGGGGFRRPKDDQKPGGGAAFRKPKEKSERVDDFDFDIDVTEAPRNFPKPARKAGPDEGKGGQGPKRERGPRPGGPARPARPEQEARRPARGSEPSDEAPELEDGKTVTAGRNAVRELLENTPRRVDGVFVRKGAREGKVQEIVALADDNRIKVQFVDDSVLRRLYSGTHQGVVAVTAAVEYAELDALIAKVMDAPLPVLLALDKVQDPGNLGAMARTAWALGAAGIIVPRHGGAYIGSGAMRASAGALHHLPVARVTNMSQALDACAEAGLSILCADAGGEDAYQAKVHLPAVLVLGGEEKGVRPGVSKHCGQKLAIPLKRDFDSLNVSQAAAILLARLGRP